MGFDIRLPIGTMFTLLGVLVAAYGALTRDSLMYARHSLGININLWWGLVMVVFGTTMLLLARRRPSSRSAIDKAGRSHDLS